LRRVGRRSGGGGTDHSPSLGEKTHSLFVLSPRAPRLASVCNESVTVCNGPVTGRNRTATPLRPGRKKVSDARVFRRSGPRPALRSRGQRSEPRPGAPRTTPTRPRPRASAAATGRNGPNSAGQPGGAKRPLRRTPPRCRHRSRRRGEREARSSRGGSRSRSASGVRDRCGQRRRPSAPRACDRARPRDPRRTGDRREPAPGSDFHYDNA
jgi:hypothetical protein